LPKDSWQYFAWHQILSIFGSEKGNVNLRAARIAKGNLALVLLPALAIHPASRRRSARRSAAVAFATRSRYFSLCRYNHGGAIREKNDSR
jgi:hypothetical protein